MWVQAVPRGWSAEVLESTPEVFHPPKSILQSCNFRATTYPDMASTLSSKSPGSGPGTSPEPLQSNAYRPIRCINKACAACRRKKSRCSGGHPYRSCRRLSEPCEYPTPVVRAPPLGPHHATEALSQEARQSNPSALAHRFDLLESRLDEVSQRLEQLTELTHQLCGPAPSDALGLGYMANQSSVPCGLTHPAGTVRASGRRRIVSGVPSDPFQSQQWAIEIDHLVPESVARTVFQDYFRFAHNQPYSFFHEGTFWKKLNEGALPDHLLLAVLSHAVRFSSDPFFRNRSTFMSLLFANIAWKSIVSPYFYERADADLATVQTITLLSLYDFTAGHDRHDSAWVKIGLAVRIAQDLRLMMNDLTTMGNAEKEERRRVFWSVYTLDRLASCARSSYGGPSSPQGITGSTT
ncbi:hypothetical protein AU210_012543 [Fusarium oxysporum f. sp. radicis-cucumerinum]|uniref:Zn(2)-C6 fungal-type domain-containing protein n=2 Tax=Fusarium oxysporum TaxID=5507 RepID=A0A2H3G623_FUSOX|nr:hypothetical protein AU210_012543 [Fusarium oxysporum f. sp. radicis-cucumerinum]RKK93387.1 hypothetical protein BFJ68_g15590 [Fusarium oxysporum]